jgi:CRISPR-associated protein Cas2
MSERRFFIISYDVADPRRLRHVAKIMEGYGHRIQYSVFESHLNDLCLEQLKSILKEELNQDADQVLFLCLGPDSSGINVHIESLGRPYVGRTRVTVV